LKNSHGLVHFQSGLLESDKHPGDFLCLSAGTPSATTVTGGQFQPSIGDEGTIEHIRAVFDPKEISSTSHPFR
jgi:hypothetical protein